MIAKIPRLVFYGVITLLTAVVWFSLREFARLPTGVHHKFVATLFLPYLLAVAVAANWYEQQRINAKRASEKKAERRTHAGETAAPPSKPSQ